MGGGYSAGTERADSKKNVLDKKMMPVMITNTVVTLIMMTILYLNVKGLAPVY